MAFFPYLWKREERREGEEEKGEKRRVKEKGNGKDYEVMGRAPAPRPSTGKCPKLSQNRSGRREKGRKIPGKNRENKVAIFDLAKAPPKSQILPVQSLFRRRRACTDMLAGRLPNGGTAVTAWSAHGDIP